MTSRLLSFGLVTAFAAAGCASTVQAEPEYEAEEAPPLRIEDQSANAPPPPPPTAPPRDAQAPMPPTPAPAPQPSSALAAPATPPSAPSAPPPPAAAPEAPPSTASWTQEYPTGRWVYANGYGWMWVPANAATADSDGVPYTYLYTPTYGWTWYISPWGPGAYRYGVWVRRPWHPVGWRGAWVARPGVVVRLGGPQPRYYHYREHGGRHRR
jgi:hypothetical protein